MLMVRKKVSLMEALQDHSHKDQDPLRTSPPDDDESDPMPLPVSGNKEEDAPHREDYFELISPDQNSVPPEGQYSDEGEVEKAQQEEGEYGDDVDVEEEEDEDEDDHHTVENIPAEEEEGEEEEGEGDNSYEQISSDEDVIADLTGKPSNIQTVMLNTLMKTEHPFLLRHMIHMIES
jgi:hypothetical protein